MGNQKANQQGFSYIDVMIAIVILTVGIMAMIGALSANIVRTFENENRNLAKQYALSAIESVISAKEIGRSDVFKDFGAIRNVQASPGPGETDGIFLNGWCPIRPDLGPDGVAGTIDDACPGTGGCGANTSEPVKGYQRQIVITDLQDPELPTPPNPIAFRNVQVTVRFNVNQAVRQETVSTIVANY